MEEDTVVGLPRPGRVVEDDPLLCVLLQGARRMLTHAIEAEVAGFLAAHDDLVDDRGRRRLVRNGHAPSRAIQTGIGPIEVRRPALLGPDAPGLSPTTIRRLVSTWQDDHRRWQGRDLSTKRYVYVWADGVYFTPRLEHDRQCVLVLIGADASGKKELLAIDDGFRESEQSWHELLVRLRDQNGLVVDPELVTGDGALGFWKAARKVWPMARQQRCWVHKTANVLNCLPKSVQTKAKADLHDIYEAASRPDAEAAFDRFLAKYRARYDRAAHCLAKDRDALLAFYDVPAEHWKHVRSTNPVESTFATVRLRTAKTKGCLSRETALAMVFKLAKSAERHWRRLNGPDRLAEIIRGVRFRDGTPVHDAEDQAAA